LVVLVSVLGSALLTGTGAFFLFSRRCLSKVSHDEICSLRLDLLHKDIAQGREERRRMSEDLQAIRADVDLLVRRNGGRR